MKLARRIAAVGRWSGDEWRVRLTQRGQSLLERARLSVGRGFGVASATAIPPGAMAVVAANAIGPLRGDPSRPREVVRQLAARDPAGFALIRAAVGRLHRGYVTLLGLDEVFVGAPPNWHREVISGKVSPHLHWSRISHLDVGAVGDHKLLWEVNRHQYLIPVALCWLADGRGEDFDLVQQHLDSWIEHNPIKVGVNWVSSLEVAYRGIAWCWLL